MGKRASSFKQYLIDLSRKLLTEAPLALLLGALPILLYSNSEQTLDEMVSGLLAIAQIINYFGWMLVPYALLAILKYSIRFNSDTGKNSFNLLHKIIAEAGSGFHTIIRTGAGVAFGITMLPNDITRATPQNLSNLYVMTTTLLIISCNFALLKDHITSKTERNIYKNTLKLDIK